MVPQRPVAPRACLALTPQSSRSLCTLCLWLCQYKVSTWILKRGKSKHRRKELGRAVPGELTEGLASAQVGVGQPGNLYAVPGLTREGQEGGLPWTPGPHVETQRRSGPWLLGQLGVSAACWSGCRKNVDSFAQGHAGLVGPATWSCRQWPSQSYEDTSPQRKQRTS